MATDSHKKNEKSGVVLTANENNGQVFVADDVVASIAGLAALEVEGVSAIGNKLTGELLVRVGVKNPSNGSKVEINGNNVRVALNITMVYGYPIPATCQQVQNKVKNAIETMTGLTVSDVNIRIAGVEV